MNSNTSTYAGLSFLGALAILFIGLKLARIAPVATWGWWCVTAPLWGPWALLLALVLGCLVLAMFDVKFTGKRD